MAVESLAVRLANRINNRPKVFRNMINDAQDVLRFSIENQTDLVAEIAALATDETEVGSTGMTKSDLLDRLSLEKTFLVNLTGTTEFDSLPASIVTFTPANTVGKISGELL